GSDVKYLHGGKSTLPLPIILGHEILGRVEKLGKDAAYIHGIKEGDRVILKGSKGCGRCANCRRGGARFCKSRIGYGGQTTCANPPHLLGGFADYLYLVPDIVATRIPDELPAEAAVLVGAVMANGFQWAVRQGGVKMGDYVLIQGPGQQGLACTFAAKCAGAARIVITGVGKDAERLDVARKFGAHRTINVEKENVVDVVREETGGEMADVVVDVSGNPQAIKASVECARILGTVVVGGLTRDGVDVPIPINLLVRRQIRWQGAFTTDNDATEIAMRAIEATKFPVQEMVTHIFSLEETEKCIRAVGGEIPELYPVKALIRP
ncbi:MAG: zinc-binding dehydrogenase, partial [Deltaproteobacteria bacterium]|nr:zinc-binding dehydrogenase [Deltaproteobacteria bacterium]